MESEFNKRLVSTVLKYIPKNKKSVVYLVNTLNISRESAYRRMRGDIPFTVRELLLLASDLGFSVDNIYDQEIENRAFFDFTRMEKDSSDFFALMFNKYNELLEKMNYAKKIDATMAFNAFPPPFFADFPNLFKFTHYKWLYQDKAFPLNKPYLETILPDSAINFQRKMKGNNIRGKNIILILDMNIFLNLIKEIQYFYHRKLLANEELLLLREDTVRMIKQYEEIAQTGLFGSSGIQLYLSPLSINSNAIYYEYDDKVEPLFWIFTINPIVIQNMGFISMQIKWLNSLKRQSSLITLSNEIMQAEFFSRQLEYVDEYLVFENTI